MNVRHFIFTIPPAVVLTIILRPLVTKIDLYKIIFLVSVRIIIPYKDAGCVFFLTCSQVAVTYTIPWDSYLIHTKVWTYPPEAILGPTLFKIPIEELFFFVVQTYVTSLLYILVNKPTLYVTYLFDDTDLSKPDVRYLQFRKRLGQVFFVGFILSSYYFSTLPSSKGTYIALICAWAGPVLLGLWCLAYQPLLTLPRSKTWLPIILPTAYLWIVDTIALLRGTWCIESGTKLGVQVWPGLEVEEALFFVVTNTLVVFGLTAFENALAVIEAFPDIYPTAPTLPHPSLLMQSSFLSPSRYDTARINGITAALANLSAKSRSFYLASSIFAGRLRVDLILLYAFCRVGDDLVDNASSAEEAERWISHLAHFLRTSYLADPGKQRLDEALAPFPPVSRAIVSLLPTQYLPSEPLFSLLEGFTSDVEFSRLQGKGPYSQAAKFPIKTASDLETYASRVASTVASLCLHLVYHHEPDAYAHGNSFTSMRIRDKNLDAGAKMGLALQYTNIARDVFVDAGDGRCYLPTDWLRERGLTPQKVIETRGKVQGVVEVRKRLLDDAFTIYKDNRGAIEDLPYYARAGIRVAVESYMEIGRVLLEKMAAGEPLEDISGSGRRNRASVPKPRRLLVGWGALTGRRAGAIPEKQVKSG
jgi:15-cis-phytoene synthase / lycopene beta-cyclase